MTNFLSRNKDGAILRNKYTEILEVDESMIPILTGDANAKSTPYGKALSHVRFETGSDSLKGLETSLFVGSARFLIENSVFSIETKVSRVKG